MSYQKKGQVFIITLNRPNQHNALDQQGIHQLEAAEAPRLRQEASAAEKRAWGEERRLAQAAQMIQSGSSIFGSGFLTLVMGV